MATKRLKSVGNDYWDLASKQFPWPIDHKDKQIFVLEDELQLAEGGLMVSHFRKHGWHIQSVMQVEKKKVYQAPVTPGPIFRGDLKKEVSEKEQLFKCNDKFRINSTGVEVMIVEYTKKSISLKYLLDIPIYKDGEVIGYRQKDNIITSLENLAKSVKMGIFVRI